MPTIGIESNGKIEKTAIYYNGDQIGGIKELFLNLDEEGIFDAVIQYEGTDGIIYTKGIFDTYPENLKVKEPSFDEEEAENLHLIEIESSGTIDSTVVLENGDVSEGIVSLLIHIKATDSKKGIASIFSKKDVTDRPVFKAQITYRNEDDSIETEDIF